MAEAIVSPLWEMLASTTIEEIQQEIKLVAGVNNEVERLHRHLQKIQDVLLDAEDKPVKERATKAWLDELKYVSYDIEDVLERWNTAMLKLRMERGNENAALVIQKKVRSFFPCHCFGFKEVALRHNIAHKIEEVNRRLDEIAREKDMYNLNVSRSTETIERIHTTSLIDVSEIYGRDDEKSFLSNKLLCESSDKNTRPYVISIVGMGGIGKTTLAQVAFKNVKNNFDKAIWVCVSDPFDEFRIAKAIIDGLKVPAPNSPELEALMHCICESIVNMKILLVLDDVWSEDDQKWKLFELCLKGAAHESRILITTRKVEVAQMMTSNDKNIINIKELNEEHCWLIFKRIAFFGRLDQDCKRLEDIGKKIVDKCKGLPLTTRSIASLLRFKKTRGEWQNILDSEIWKLEKIEKDVFNPLLLSYNDLPCIVKQCFLYCIIFPKDHIIRKDELIKLWMAQGYLGLGQNKEEMEDNGEKYFNHLATRSFFQEFLKDKDDNIIECKMHDIVHDFAQSLSKNEYFTMELFVNKSPSVDPSIEKTIHHSMIIASYFCYNTEYSNTIFSFKKLRSLLFFVTFTGSTHGDMVLKNIIDKLRYLRALDIRATRFLGYLQEIPAEIGQLVHLRYLNLFGQGFKKLPGTLCDLYHLQTLDIRYCCELEELPEGIGRLINLRHLLNENTSSLGYIPIGIERLTCLRTLSEFVETGEDDSKACTLKSLNNFNHLSRRLKIVGLGRLSLMGETKVLELKNLEHILGLKLYFTECDENREGRTRTDNETVLEAVQPHPNLEELTIKGYGGTTISCSWMMLLTNLRKLYLRSCRNCKHLSPLGKLQSLESLALDGSIGAERVGNEFWGIDSDGASSSLTFFPSLTHLSVYDMHWKEWNYENASDGETNITIMPSLKSLIIMDSRYLKTLPDIFLQSTTLKELDITESILLEERYNKETGEDWPKISHIPKFHISNLRLRALPRLRRRGDD